MEIILYIVSLFRMVVMSMTSFFGMLLAYWFITLPVILCLVLLSFAIRFMRALASRIMFVRKIKLLVDKKGGKYTACRLSITSLFLNNEKNDMYLDIGSERYVIKFFPKNPLNRNVYLENLETAYLTRRGAQTIKGRHGGRVNFIFNKVEEKMKKRRLKIEPTEHKTTVLIFDPSPYEVYILDKNKYRITGSGEPFEGIMLYMGDEFIQYLQRQ